MFTLLFSYEDVNNSKAGINYRYIASILYTRTYLYVRVSCCRCWLPPHLINRHLFAFDDRNKQKSHRHRRMSGIKFVILCSTALIPLLGRYIYVHNYTGYNVLYIIVYVRVKYYKIHTHTQYNTYLYSLMFIVVRCVQNAHRM